MKVTIVQHNIIWAAPEKNREALEAKFAELDATDLIVLPEVFTAGFGTLPEVVAEPEEGGPTLAWMQQMAARHDCAVSGSVPVVVKSDKPRSNDAVVDGHVIENNFERPNIPWSRFVNRSYFVKPDGSYAFYDKRHLFIYGGEWPYSSGDKRTVVEWRGVRFLLQVCYDVRFPLWSRNFGDYDVILYSGNWPTSRIGQWTALLRARAIENQAYVVGVNRVGTDPLCDYPGASVIVHPYGYEIADCGDRECAESAVLEIDKLRTLRERFPVLKEQDPIEVIMKLADDVRGREKMKNVECEM